MYNREDFINITSALDNHIENRGIYWRHKFFSEYNSKANPIDKHIQDSLRCLIKESRPTNGVFREDALPTFKAVKPHVGSKNILHIDIRHYFESITFESIRKSLEKKFNDDELEFIKKFYFNNGLKRGLFASPLLSEIMGIKIDGKVNKIFYEQKCKSNVTYTRYYDDLIISGGSKEKLRKIEEAIIIELSNLGLNVNPKKTKLLNSSSAKLLGLQIHGKEIVVPKRFRNKLRVRIKFAKDKIENISMDDIDSIGEAMFAVGSVIGSARYIINNSTVQQQKYKDIIKAYAALYAKLRALYDALSSDNPIVGVSDIDVKKVENEAITFINSRRHYRKYASEEELQRLDEDIEKIKQLGA